MSQDINWLYIGDDDSNSGRGRLSFLLYSVQTVTGAHPVSNSVGNGGSFPEACCHSPLSSAKGSGSLGLYLHKKAKANTGLQC
jgi:hypothetical protein